MSAQIKVLAVSDQIDQRIYSETLRQRMPDIDLVVSCGDLPARYLEFLADALDRPVYYVLGNHAEELTRGGAKGKRHHPLGTTDLGSKVVRDPGTGLIFAGIPGSPRYNKHEPVQYNEWQVFLMLLGMAPRLLWNRLRHGRALDILVTHTPPRDVNDRPDQAHRGFKVLRRFLEIVHPPYLLHGHIHLYDRSEPHIVRFAATQVINVYPYQVLDLAFSLDRSGAPVEVAEGPAPGAASPATPGQASPPASADPATH